MRGEESLRGEAMSATPERIVRHAPTSSHPSARASPVSLDLRSYLPDLGEFDVATLRTLREVGEEVLECRRVLAKAGLNVVGEVLRGEAAFVEMEHYPHDDVFDRETHAQYYYHAHRGEVEHGHFHTFLRAGGMPEGVAPLLFARASEAWPAGDDAISHLVAISMDGWGEPIGLFACNRWVTGETWYPAEDVIRMLAYFEIDHAWPSWPTNRWLGAMLRLYRPWIEALLWHRDAVLGERLRAQPARDVFEDRALEITGYLPISVNGLMADLEALTDGRHPNDRR